MRDTSIAKQAYAPDPVPNDPTQLQNYLQRELNKLQNAVNAGTHLEQLHAAPDKPRSGMVVYADGTDWNPGSGEGAYIYRGAAWHFLG